jgi:type VI secretion system FHA domain protein
VPLTLTIRNVGELENGSPLSLVLDRRGAIIGRSATTDWCLPDPALHISSRHCEIRFADGRYELIDMSTNGTFLNHQAARLAAPHTIGQGDLFLIGRYEIEARLDEAAASAAAQRNAAPAVPQWQGWQAAAGQAAPTPAPVPVPPPAPEPVPAPAPSGWGAPPPPPPQAPAPSGWGTPPAPAAPPPPAGPSAAPGWAAAAPPPPPPPPAPPASIGWGAPPPPPEAPPPAASPWDVAPAPAAMPASDWSSPASPAPPPSGGDIWGRFAESNVVDWARGGFGSPPPAPPTASIAETSFEPRGVVSPGDAPPPLAEAYAPARTEPPPAGAAGGNAGGLAAFAAAAGVDPARLSQGEAETLTMAGDVLRRLIAGMVVMLEARARAKSQMGAQNTSLEFSGNNPLKFARTPDQALAQLLNPAERGFMSSDRAVEDAFKDLQAHQMATLVAMQGALRATLERFSPKAIRARAETGGLLAKIMPTARDAALWNAYEREFSGVALGSDEAFMDMFAKEFRRAYEEMAQKR